MARNAKKTKQAPFSRTEFHLKLVCTSEACLTGADVAEILRRAAADLERVNEYDLTPPENTAGGGSSGGRITGPLPLCRMLHDRNGNHVGQYLVAEVES